MLIFKVKLHINI